MTGRRVPPEVYAILSSLIEERAGLHYASNDREIFGDKVTARADEAGFESLLDYYYFLRYDDPTGVEMKALVDALVVNETYLFREADQLDVLIDEFIVPRVKAGRRPRIWSAASSTGEEPYGLAMLLAERGGLDQVDIVASDVSERVLARARSGVISQRSVERSPRRALAVKHLEPLSDGWRVPAAIASHIDFRRVNLVEPASWAGLGAFDVILARNVFIYFRDDTVRRVLEQMAALLAGDGALCVGVSESLMRFGSSLVCEERGGVFVYRKEAA